MNEKLTRFLSLFLVFYLVVSGIISFVAGTFYPIISAVLLAIVFLWVVKVSRRNQEAVDEAMDRLKKEAENDEGVDIEESDLAETISLSEEKIADEDVPLSSEQENEENK